MARRADAVSEKDIQARSAVIRLPVCRICSPLSLSATTHMELIGGNTAVQDQEICAVIFTFKHPCMSVSTDLVLN